MSKELRNRGLVRQWKLVRALEQSRLGLSWSQLKDAGEDTVHLRTIRRDIDTLTLAGFPIAVQSNNGGETTRIYMERSVH